MTAVQNLTTTDLLRHLVATLAYRATRVLEDAPPSFGDFSAGQGVMTSREMLAHVSTILGFANSQFAGTQFDRPKPGDWNHELKRFYDTLAELDGTLAKSAPKDPGIVLKMIQGPLADALTHVGQLATLRRLSGSPVAKDHYIKAEVQIGRVGADQPSPAVAQAAK
jgi:hypothetical protein